MISIAAITSKVMVLILVAVFSDGTMDTQSFVGPNDPVACLAQSQVVANEWKDQQPTILAILPDCHELDDPRVLLEQFLKEHPEITPETPKHVPTGKEASN